MIVLKVLKRLVKFIIEIIKQGIYKALWTAWVDSGK
jgi:hypothetical protein